eukprot:gene18281-28177_t
MASSRNSEGRSETEMELVDVEEVDVKDPAETRDTDAGKVIEVPADSGKHGMWSAVFNFVNSIIGAGIIGLPFALEEGGLILGVILLLVAGYLTFYSVRLLIELGDKMGEHEYEGLCRALLGKGGFYVASLSMGFFAYGAMLTYLIIIGDTMAPVLQSWTGVDLLGNRTAVILICGCCICLPLSSLRDIGKLGKTSAVSILGVCALVVMVCVHSWGVSEDYGIRSSKRLGWLGAVVEDSSITPGTWWYVWKGEECSVARAPVFSTGPKGFFYAVTEEIDGQSHDVAVARFAFNRTAYIAHNECPSAECPHVAAPKITLLAGSLSSAFSCAYSPEVLAPQPDVFKYAIPADTLNLSAPATGEAVLSHPFASIEWNATNDDLLSFKFRLEVTDMKAQEDAYSFSHTNVMPALGVISFAYVCQHSTFLVRNSLKDPSQWPQVCRISVGIATVASILMSVFGYVSFLRCTRPDILNNFMEDDNVANAARLVLAMTMFFTFPMEFFVVRQAATSLVLGGDASGVRHWVATGAIFAATLPLGLVFRADQLGLVLEFTGGLAASALGFILPGVLWFAFA